MMNSLFSSFDPMTGLFNINYCMILIFMSSPILFSFTMYLSRNSQIVTTVSSNLGSELNSTVSNNFKKGKIIMLISLFWTLICLNVSGLMPYVFSLTAHMLMTLSMGLPLWLGFMLFGVSKNTSHFFSHLVPLSTPMALSQFMVIIESVSQLIRPITLSVRLAANMTAGHILMGLTSSNITLLNMSSSVLMVLIVLETAVAFIQSYVFTVLISMYLSEA